MKNIFWLKKSFFYIFSYLYIVTITYCNLSNYNKLEDLNFNSNNKIANSTNDNKGKFFNERQDVNEGIASLALWLILVILIVPFILLVTVILFCCKYLFNWCRPRGQHYHIHSPPLIIQGSQTYVEPSSTNFNA